MSNKYVKEANELLRNELDPIWPGPNPPQGKFQLKWSESLRSIIPVYEDKGDQRIDAVMDYYCECGVNVSVHASTCLGLTLARIRTQFVNTFGPGGEHPAYQKCWALCRWVVPPSIFEWCETGGTEADYPGEGRYVPVSKGPMCIVVPPKATGPEIVESARLIIKMMREQIQRKDKLLADEKAKSERRLMPIFDQLGREVIPADKGTPYWDIYERVKESSPRFDPDATVGYSKEINLNTNKEQKDVNSSAA